MVVARTTGDHAAVVETTVAVFQLDVVLKKIGGLNRNQMLQIALILFILFTRSISGYNYLFYARVPDYRCEITECEGSNTEIYKPEWLSEAVPFKNAKTPEKCDRYPYITDTTNDVDCQVANFQKNTTIHCDTYIFNTEFIGIAREFGIYCDQNLWKLTLPPTIQYVGLLVGLPIFGYFGDRIGRKKILILLTFLGGLICEIQALVSTNYWTVILLEFLNGVAHSGAFPAAFTLVLELLGPKYRSVGATLTFSSGVLGEVCLAFIAMHAPTWRTMVIISSIMPLFVIVYGWIIPESIRWLLAKKKFDKANTQLEKIAKSNGTVLEMNDYATKETVAKGSAEQPLEKFTILFTSWRMRLRILASMYSWVTCTFLFYGITLGSVTIFGNIYWNFIMVALMEIPGNIGALVLTQTIGRKKTLCGAYFIAGLSCLTFVILKDDNWIKLAVYMLGKSSITTAFMCVYIFTTELYPTPFRQRLMGICSSFGRLGSIMAPQMPFLANIWQPLPFIAFTTAAMIASLISLSFPETLNTKLPDTYEQALHIRSPTKEDGNTSQINKTKL